MRSRPPWCPITEPGDSIAIAHVEKEIDGIFKILAKYDPNDSVFVLIEKPFTDKATRNIIFRRVARDPIIYWRNWLPVATSLVEGGTDPQPVGDEINLTMIQMFLPNGDTITVTDPNSYYLRYRWVRHLSGGPNGGPPFDGGHRDVNPESMLPYPKERIRQALMTALNHADDKTLKAQLQEALDWLDLGFVPDTELPDSPMRNALDALSWHGERRKRKKD